MLNELKFLSQSIVFGRTSRRDFLGRAVALGATAAMANTMLAEAALAAGPVKGGSLKFGLQGGSSTDTLDPALASSLVPFHLCRSWGEQLVALAPRGDLVARLATEWDSTPDAKTWVFKIRKGVQFHNGKEMSPDDVVATIERHSNKDSKSGALGLMRGIESVKRDGDSVVFALKSPNADLPFLLADYHLVIQPNGGKDAPAAGIGTGPYRFLVNEPGTRHVGTRFANYWASADRGHAEQIEFLVLNDSTARMAALQSGRVHMVNKVEPKVVELIKRAPGVTIQTTSGRAHYSFVAHCNTAPFDNLDLRLALKYAIDRKDMVDKILRGHGSVGNDFPINDGYPLFSALPQREFDLDRASFHFKKSGFKDTILLRTAEVAFAGAVDAAQLFQATCAKAGIKMEVKREPNDGYFQTVWNKQPFAATFWGAGRATQDQLYSTAYLSTADWNDTRQLNPKLDQLIIAARGEINQAKRKAMYRDIAVIVRDEGGAIIPMFADLIDAVGPKVGGWVRNPNAELMNGTAATECWLGA